MKRTFLKLVGSEAVDPICPMAVRAIQCICLKKKGYLRGSCYIHKGTSPSFGSFSQGGLPSQGMISVYNASGRGS